MSTIIKFPSNINIKIINLVILNIIGPLGEANLNIAPSLNINISLNNEILIESNKLAQLNTHVSLINNILIGLTEGYSKRLKLEGVGYRVSAVPNENKLIFRLGYSHDINYLIPKNIKIEVINPNLIEVKGINKVEIGQCIAEIKRIRKTSPYRIKGIYPIDEKIIIKSTKKK